MHTMRILTLGVVQPAPDTYRVEYSTPSNVSLSISEMVKDAAGLVAAVNADADALTFLVNYGFALGTGLVADDITVSGDALYRMRVADAETGRPMFDLLSDDHL